ncbi:MAG: alpha-amlyase [Spirochaetaceae bacterium]|nr:MAG: alpha-amlyase [Spirochaetaceae bacterium]
MQATYYLPIPIPGPPREFHVARAARDTYEFSENIFSVQGHVLFTEVRGARDFAMRINAVRKSALHPDRAVRAGDIYAMGLIDEIFHYVIGLYLQQYGRELLDNLQKTLRNALGPVETDRLLLQFADRFPTVATYKGEQTPQESLDRVVGGVSGRDVALEELIVLWVGNRNPAFYPLLELFDEQLLAADTGYERAMKTVQTFFADLPAFGPEDQTLLELLRAPAIRHPQDLHAQLDYIRTRWGSLVGSFLDRILRSLDYITEEQKARFPGTGESEVLEYDWSSGGGDEDYARFSPDREWMPRAVIIAKSTLVWLDQLSKKYQYEIRTLEEIPDQELDTLGRQGFTALWLIGLWQRSGASRRIKNLCGNPEAEASAYSLYDYEIARELGGWDALDNLRRRLWQRGIRVASDMVPNHTGIDSRWVHEHPEWYISLPHSPFPGYTFHGENLSTRDGVGIYLEDHYYDRSDAAVVFKRVDSGTGEERYIYHGNDGTSMPWNDTAQLDYLNAEVREAVIRTILEVARNFPIIRFDAAMTLAKKHIQRLWYPAPGQGGDIPSRAEHGLSQADFDAAIPVEFWREVVDRVAQEVPDTLLLAEAFWMMESYFVRNLGMHRVYNSAFMNMLKNEDNEKYRRTIKNTLEYDPEVLKRFVNFMNNPDEDTAVAQFGTGDKYFGVATLMVTMPGLPMFGHGQIEGLAEKYGMEYRKAYWDETPNEGLIERHTREIFPLIHRRHIFADATHFRLYDVYDADGNVQPHVYVYSNRHGDERALVLYNNSYESIAGWVHTSAPYVLHGDEARTPYTEQLIPALGLHASWHHYVIFQEQRSGLWYIRNSAEIAERGLFLELKGYESQVFLNIYEEEDNRFSHYARLADHLNGAGTPDIHRCMKRLMLQPLHDAFGMLANTGVLRNLRESLLGTVAPVDWEELAGQYRTFLGIAAQFCEHTTRMDEAIALFQHNGEALDRLAQLVKHAPDEVGALIASHLEAEREDASVFLALTLLLPLDVFINGEDEISPQLVGFYALDQAGEWQLIETIKPILAQIQPDGELPGYWEQLVQITLAHHNWWRYTAPVEPEDAARTVIEVLLADPNVERFLQIHLHQGTTWFNQEAFELLTDWLLVIGAWHELTAAVATGARVSWKRVTRETAAMARMYRQWMDAEQNSGFRVDQLFAALEPSGASPSPGGKRNGGKRSSGSTGSRRKKSGKPGSDSP